MASTNIPAVKAAVLKVLESAKALEDITVSGDKEPERDTEYVWIYKAKAKRQFTTIGKQPAAQDEMVEVHLRVFAVDPGATYTDVEARAVEIFEAVESALRDSPTLDGTAFFQHVEELEIEPLLLDQNWACHVLVTLAAKTRI